jgi:RHS repeat-associated protein
MTTDHLGSPRVITDKNGNVISRRDFMPFGEEIGVDTVQTSNRSNNSQYATADTVRQKYTGYQKDEETKLDFAEARMYQNKHGRFTAVDPLMASASAMNPQTFNRYSYTGNNPINYTDPSGLKWVMLSDGTFDWKDDNYVLQDGESNLNGEGHLVISGSGCAARKCFSKGNIIIFHANHTITVIKNPTQAQIAIVQGNTVNETVNVSTTPAETIASTHTGSSSGSRTLAPLPCVPGYPCGENAGTGSDAGSTDEELLEVLHTTADVADASEIPVISQIGSLVGMGIDAHRGDYTSVALGAVSMIPVIGAAATYAKVGRRLHRAEEAIDIASDVVRHSPCALCFTAETMVETTDGLKPIEKIEIGDKVLSYNEETKQNEYQVILDTFKRFADDIYSIKIQGEKRALEVTSEHPFYIKVHQARSDLSSEDDEGEWEEVRDLEVGDEIRLASGSWAKILDIKFKGKGQVFNFSVAGNHNYYVGNSRLLTHNTNCPCKWAPGIQNYQAGNMTSIQHVITRHGPNAPTGASKFAGNLTEKKVIKLSKEMFKKGTMLTNGKAIIHDFGRIIGTDKAGNPTQYGVVFLNNAGQARSMFPF